MDPGRGLHPVAGGLNLPSVKNFGETEFWFALVKIVAIGALIVIGLVMVITGFEHNGVTASFTNLWSDGGMFPTGFMGFVAGFQIAVFAFVGIELVGTTAAETKDPETTLPRAINSIPIRILFFYVGALVILMAVQPWNLFSAEESPFVGMFALAGLAGAAGIVNFVVLTSATSSANSGIYSTSRMIHGLAEEGDAPKVFAKLSRTKVPRNALLFSCMFLLAGVALLYAEGSVAEAFTLVTTISALRFMFVWSIILVSYIVYRKSSPAAARGEQVQDARRNVHALCGARVLRLHPLGADHPGRHPEALSSPRSGSLHWASGTYCFAAARSMQRCVPCTGQRSSRSTRVRRRSTPAAVQRSRSSGAGREVAASTNQRGKTSGPHPQGVAPTSCHRELHLILAGIHTTAVLLLVRRQGPRSSHGTPGGSERGHDWNPGTSLNLRTSSP